MKTLKFFLISGIGILLYTFSYSQQLSLRQITFSDSTHDGYPYWTHDGKYIMYGSGTRNSHYMMKIPIEDGNPVQLTDFFAQHARLSPDGNYMIFDGDFGNVIQISCAHGGKPVRVVPESIPIFNSGMPCWSPTGDSIVFHSLGDIYIMELETGKADNIFQIENKLAVPYCWIPNGNEILMSVIDTVTRFRDIWRLHVKTGTAKQITFLEGYQDNPQISPDGSMILFASMHGGNADLWVMSSKGGDPVQLTFYEGDDSNPGYDLEASWSPDGKKIAFSSTRTGYWAIWVMELDMEFIIQKLKNLE